MYPYWDKYSKLDIVINFEYFCIFHYNLRISFVNHYFNITQLLRNFRHPLSYLLSFLALDLLELEKLLLCIARELLQGINNLG